MNRNVTKTLAAALLAVGLFGAGVAPAVGNVTAASHVKPADTVWD